MSMIARDDPLHGLNERSFLLRRLRRPGREEPVDPAASVLAGDPTVGHPAQRILSQEYVDVATTAGELVAGLEP